MADEPQTLEISTTDLAATDRLYAVAIDPYTVTVPQLAALVMIMGFVVPHKVYENIPGNIKHLFRVIENAPTFGEK